MVFTVFVSHSVKDLQLVYLLKSWLESRGINVYIAEESPEPGKPLPKKIAEAIDRSDVVLALLTSDGARSQWVHQEIGYAIKAGKLVIPVIEEGVEVKGFLTGVEYISFRRDNPWLAIQYIVSYIEKLKTEKEKEEALKTLAMAILFFMLLLAFRRT
jgi:hypothetical protein